MRIRANYILQSITKDIARVYLIQSVSKYFNYTYIDLMLGNKIPIIHEWISIYKQLD